MKNPTTFITKDGVSDANLIRAARDMYDVLDEVDWLLAFLDEGQPETIARIEAALDKARGVRS
jgi:hypothetical protein